MFKDENYLSSVPLENFRGMAKNFSNGRKLHQDAGSEIRISISEETCLCSFYSLLFVCHSSVLYALCGQT